MTSAGGLTLLAAAWLAPLVLDAARGRRPGPATLWPGLAVLVAALVQGWPADHPVPGLSLAFAFAFASVLMGLAGAFAHASHRQAWLRMAVALGAGLAAIALAAVLTAHLPLPALAGAAIPAMMLPALFLPAADMRRRLAECDAPRRLRGEPLVAIACAVMALALAPLLGAW